MPALKDMSLPPISTQPLKEPALAAPQKTRRKLYLFGLIALSILGLIAVAVGWNGSPKPAPKLTAIGEGELREGDTVRLMNAFTVIFVH